MSEQSTTCCTSPETHSSNYPEVMSRATSMAELFRSAAEYLNKGINVCFATVVDSHGSSPSAPGQKMFVSASGYAAGTVGGGAVERAVVEKMLQLLDTNRFAPEMQTFALAKDLAMACGGSATVLYEPIQAATPVLLVGAGHIGSALAMLLYRLGFHVIITDEREAAIAQQCFKQIANIDARLGAPDQVAQEVAASVPVLVATHDHALDEAAVIWAVQKGHVYVGGVGSHNKAVKVRNALKQLGVAQELIAAVRMPVGLAIGGRSPEEIALSIAAELVAWRAGKLHALVAEPSLLISR